MARALAGFASLLVVAAFAAGCAESASDAEEASEAQDPKAVLEETAASGPIESGVVDASAEGTIAGSGWEGTSTIAAMGPFERGAEGRLPGFDLDLELEGSLDGERQHELDLGATAADGAGYVELGGESYELSERVLRRFESVDLSRLQPTRWVVDPTLAGTEEVAGVEALRVSGRLDFGSMRADLQPVADRILGSRADLSGLRIPGARWEGTLEGGAFEGALDISVTFSDVTKAQEIEPPEDPRPLGELVEEELPYPLRGLGELLGLPAARFPG